MLKLTFLHKVQLIWVPGPEGIAGNETAGLLTRTGSEHLNQLAASQLELPRKRSGTEQKSHKTMEIQNWTQTDKGTYIGPSARITKNLFELNKDQLRWVIGLFT
jgi:hypothetical protein